MLVGARPRYAEFTPDGKQLWVTSEVGGGVTVIDPVDARGDSLRITFAVPGLVKEQIQPVGIRFSKRRQARLRRARPRQSRRGGRCGDLASRSNICLVGQRVWQLELTPDGKTLITTNGVTNDISVIDVSSLKVVKSIAVGSFPWGAAISSK